MLRISSDSSIRNRRFSSLLLRQNRSKPLRFFRRFDRFSSIFKRKKRRFSSVSKRKKHRFSSVSKRKKRRFSSVSKRKKRRFSSVSKRKKRRFSSVSKRKKRRFSSVSKRKKRRFQNVRSVDFRRFQNVRSLGFHRFKTYEASVFICLRQGELNPTLLTAIPTISTKPTKTDKNRRKSTLLTSKTDYFDKTDKNRQKPTLLTSKTDETDRNRQKPTEIDASYVVFVDISQRGEGVGYVGRYLREVVLEDRIGGWGMKGMFCLIFGGLILLRLVEMRE